MMGGEVSESTVSNRLFLELFTGASYCFCWLNELSKLFIWNSRLEKLEASNWISTQLRMSPSWYTCCIIQTVGLANSSTESDSIVRAIGWESIVQFVE